MERSKPRINREKGMITLDILCNGKDTGFVLSSLANSYLDAPNSYEVVFQRIISRGLRPATGEETAFLLYTIFHETNFIDSGEDSSNPKPAEITGLFQRFYRNEERMWIANRTFPLDSSESFRVPLHEKGFCVVYDEKGLGKELVAPDYEDSFKESKVINGVRFSKDGKIKSSCASYKDMGSMKSLDEFEENKIVIANFGLEGAKKLRSVAFGFSWLPIVGLEDVSSFGLYFPVPNYKDYGGYNGGIKINNTSYALEDLRPKNDIQIRSVNYGFSIGVLD